ncbi:hypothetical protein KFZ56_19125 [Virgibacillus sp. NKC19-3]|uniref:hypothetical protein n=1 Tax=Virgibacillus saliphilus TaxID=2831674 RepID=UPI001C9AAD75|nr:hypothetical protein [Virgibacillus sp. NKC19-3]MBY7145135.1 hypothetical protein [Virgibacillus sp. NKC19-3]
MRKQTKIFCYNIALLLIILFLVGCADGTNEESETAASEDDAVLESEDETETDEKEEEGEPASTTEPEDDNSGDTNDTSSERTNDEEPSNNNTDESDNASGSEEDNPLSGYSSEKIEYARVWLQLGEIKDVDELNVHHIPAGTPLNPDDETSADYPEDVIQLAGGRLVAGSVTYSGNGDGTINVYNVPLRWDGNYPAGEEFYQDIIENTKQEYIDIGDDEEVITLIDKMNID